jgi:REP element-mobilizing transposase RayT
LFLFGAATKTDERRSVARKPHDRALRLKAKSALKYAPVKFTGLRARAIARGFAHAAREAGYIVYACSIMPDHPHMVVARCERDAEKIVGPLKARATQELLTDAPRIASHPAGRGSAGTYSSSTPKTSFAPSGTSTTIPFAKG